MTKKGWFSWFGKGKQSEENKVVSPEKENGKSEHVSETVNENSAEHIETPAENVVAETEITTETENSADAALLQDEKPLPIPKEKPGFFKRLVNGLKKTRENLGLGIKALFKGRKIDDELFEDLESTLITADIGIETTEKLIEKLTAEASLRE
ncbi:MAG: signal recognition particle receptor subunit alpha, partial [Ruminobacter sp.]|nr:signal recognition particle receptor subunit alpha [Ruminobacter sp.]